MKPKTEIIKSPEAKRYQILIALSLVSSMFILAAAVSTGLTSFIVKAFAEKPKAASCIPLHQDYNLPFIHKQSRINPVNSDTIIKRFIEQYIALTKNEEYINYHAATNNSRYNDAKVSEAKWKAIYLSIDDAQDVRRREYFKSSDILQTLKKGRLGWNFFPDSMVVRGQSDGGVYHITVLGEYRVITDQNYSRLPAQLDGYWELTYYVIQGAPSETAERKYINDYGLYVAWEEARLVSPGEKEFLMSRDARFFQREDQ